MPFKYGFATVTRDLPDFFGAGSPMPLPYVGRGD